MPYVVGSLPNLHSKHELGICHKPTFEENREQILTGARATCIYHTQPLRNTICLHLGTRGPVKDYLRAPLPDRSVLYMPRFRGLRQAVEPAARGLDPTRRASLLRLRG